MNRFVKILLFSIIIISLSVCVAFASDSIEDDYSLEDEYGYTQTGVSSAGMPSWYKEGFGPSDVFHNDPSTPRVVDYAGIFNSGELESLKSQLAQMKQKYNMDFVLVTDDSAYELGRRMYAAEFYDMNGYGVGPNYSGVVMFISMEPGNRGWFTAGTGDAEKFFTEKNVNHMDDTMEPYMHRGEYAEGVSAYFNDLDTLLTNGKFPLTFGSVLKYLFIASIAGLVAGLISLSSASVSMKGLAQSVVASNYLVPDSVRVDVLNDTFLRTNVTKTLIQSSSSRSGGGSSYSGGFHSSGGHSFSGGGRGF